MDIFSFINSKNIRDYNREQGTEFTLPQAAYLIWQSAGATWREKTAAWKELISTTKDCGMPGRNNIGPIISFHEALKKYIDLKERQFSAFRDNNSCVYTYAIMDKDDLMNGNGYCSENRFFLNYEECVSHLSDTITMYKMDGWDISYVKVQKYPLSGSSAPSEALFMNENLDFLSLDAQIPEKDFMTLYFFEDMWFDIPTPFKRGDILVSGPAFNPQWSYPSRPFVLNSISSWNTRTMIERGCSPAIRETIESDRITRNLANFGDCTDMSYNAYFAENSEIYRDNAPWYLSLEKYQGQLGKEFRILQSLSDTITGKQDITDFLFDYQEYQVRNYNALEDIS